MILLTEEELRNFRATHNNLVVTNGCFDILHRGHVSFLRDARANGSCLLVGINSDAAVQALKGPTRPINNELARAEVLDALRCVNGVYIFDSCVSFLDLAKPDVYCKAGDYSIETLNKSELNILQKHGSKIVFTPFVDGYSTTKIIQK